jgi:hypothetical protein
MLDDRSWRGEEAGRGKEGPRDPAQELFNGAAGSAFLAVVLSLTGAPSVGLMILVIGFGLLALGRREQRWQENERNHGPGRGRR